jgi:hypothetical protein
MIEGCLGTGRQYLLLYYYYSKSGFISLFFVAAYIQSILVCILVLARPVHIQIYKVIKYN